MRKVYPMVCPQCGDSIMVVAFITDYAAVELLIDYLKLRSVAVEPPPPHVAYQEVLTAAETSAEYSS